MLYRLTAILESVDKILKCGHSNESYQKVLSCGAVYCTVQGGANFQVCESGNLKSVILQIKATNKVQLSFDIVYYAEQGGSHFQVCESGKLLSRTFLWCCLKTIRGGS